MSFAIGQKVECVEQPLMLEIVIALMFGSIIPEKGKVYTIRSCVPCGCGGHAWVRLVEIVNRPIDGHECDFDSRLFRPVIERKTDISCFTSLLNPAKYKVLDPV